METVPCNRCDFQECEVVRQKHGESGYILTAKCYGCGKYRVLSKSEFAGFYEKMDEIPIDEKPDTMEQRAADRQKYYKARSEKQQSVVSPKLGIQHYPLTGLVAGIGFSALLARLYLGTPSTETNLAELLTAPLVILIVPAVAGLTIGIALRAFAYGRDSRREVPSPFGGKQPLLLAEVSTLGLGIGVFLGAIAALVIFFFTPLPGHGFFSHIIFGLLTGGAVGAVIGPCSTLIDW